MYFHTTKFLGNFFFLHNSHCVRPGDGGVIKSCRDFCPIVYCYYFYHYYYYHYYFSLQGCSHCGDVKSVILRKKCHIAIVTQKVACYCYVKSVMLLLSRKKCHMVDRSVFILVKVTAVTGEVANDQKKIKHVRLSVGTS